MSFTMLPEGAPAPLPSSAPAVRAYRPERQTSNAIGPVTTGLALVGAVGGYGAARYVDTDLFVLIALAWWVVSAVSISLLVRRSSATAAIVSVFLFLFVALPFAGAATFAGLAGRAVAVFQDDFSDLSEQFQSEFEDYEEGDFDPAG